MLCRNNIISTFNPPKNALGGGRAGISDVDKYFLPPYLFEEYAVGLFQHTNNRGIFEHFILKVNFTRTNTIKPFTRAIGKLWEFHRFTHYFNDQKDTSPRYLTHYIDTLMEALSDIFPVRGQHIITKRGWRLWRGSFLTRKRSFDTIVYLYKALGELTVYSLHRKISSILHIQSLKSVFLVYWTFTKTHRLYVNMRNSNDVSYNYLSLSPGLFLKFYKNRRPLKRTKLFKLLLVRFLRKILILSGILSIDLIVNRSPTLFLELYKSFLTPDIVPFKVPKSRKLYDDLGRNSKTAVFSVERIAFLRTKYYGLFRERLRGRLKRKVARRLIKKNNVMD